MLILELHVYSFIRNSFSSWAYFCSKNFIIEVTYSTNCDIHLRSYGSALQHGHLGLLLWAWSDVWMLLFSPDAMCGIAMLMFSNPKTYMSTPMIQQLVPALVSISWCSHILHNFTNVLCHRGASLVHLSLHHSFSPFTFFLRHCYKG